jgi:ABC-type dipeptide/oligopeptide/nickel transport system ATPase component
MTPIVEVRDLRVRFTGERTVHAVNGVDISLAQGEVLGLLGESGSGKSVTLRALLNMLTRVRFSASSKTISSHCYFSSARTEVPGPSPTMSKTVSSNLAPS